MLQQKALPLFCTQHVSKQQATRNTSQQPHFLFPVRAVVRSFAHTFTVCASLNGERVGCGCC